MITIADAMAEYQIPHVDFLKIDVEGLDFDVLKGVPWDLDTPDVIESEFEDAKTIPRGHSSRDMAEYLRRLGYAVYVSEWHPIIRYGIRHDWRRVVPYPGFEIPSNSWGNLLAFKDDPGHVAVQQAFASLVWVEPAEEGERVDGGDAVVSEEQPRPFYADSAERLRERSPAAYSVLRAGRRFVVRVWRTIKRS